MPRQSFSVSNFYDYVVTGSVKTTMKNTITRKPCSFPRPFVSLRIRRVTHRAIEDLLYLPALLKRVLPADGTQAWESLTAGWRGQSPRVLQRASKCILMSQVIAATCSCYNSGRAAAQKRGCKNLPALYGSTGKGRWLWMGLLWQDSNFF